MESANHTQVKLVFESSTVNVVKEEDAYSVESFVADLGGVLGLFVGFNFLMAWDFVVFLRDEWNPLKKVF